MTTSNTLFICPECGSPYVEYSSLAGGDAKCKVCEWTGKREGLLVVPFSDSLVTPDAAVKQFAHDLKMLMARDMGTKIIGILVKWGFLQLESDAYKRNAVKYVANIGKAMALSILKTRAEIEIEDVKSRSRVEDKPS